MSKKSIIVLEDAAVPFLGCHAAGANGYCFCPVMVAPSAADAAGGGSLVAQFPRGAAALEAAQVLDVAERSLSALDSSLAQGTKIEQFIAHSAVAAPYLEVRATRMETATRPASTNVQVAGLVHPNALIGIQLIAHAGGPPKEPIVVPGMPASPGKPFKPAPHAVVHGNFVFVTGQVSYDFDEGYPAAAEIDEDSWYQSKATAEARYIMGKIARILRHLGGSLDDCVKLEIYLNDLSDVVDLEKVMREAHGDDLPARSYIPTIRLGPTHCRVEVNAICRKPGTKGIIARIRDAEAERGWWLDPIATEHGGFLFTSSMAGNKPGRLDIALPLAEQITRIFEKLQQLPPLRGTGAESVLFASVQIPTSVDLGELRWNFQQVKGQETIAISPVVVQAPLIWARGGVQADFICSIG
jgi:enamine deaminase RidA (YjgF/YER057c/UK114 family)